MKNERRRDVEKVDLRKLWRGRTILAIVFLLAFFSTGFSKYIGGEYLIGGVFPGFYIIVLINIILIFASVWYYNANFVPEELHDEVEGNE